MWEEGSTKCVLGIIDLFFLAMLHNNRKKSLLLLGLTHFTPTRRINGHFSKGMVIWIRIFSFTLLHCINYNCRTSRWFSYMYISLFESFLVTESSKYYKSHSANNKNGFQWGEMVWSMVWELQSCLRFKNIKEKYIQNIWVTFDFMI